MKIIARSLSILFLYALALSSAIHGQSNPADGVSTVVGNGEAGLADGKQTDARFMAPSDLALNPRTHTLFLTDFAAQRVREIDNDGVVTTVAGSGVAAPDGLEVFGGYQDGPAADALFDHPTGIAVGPDGTIYIADTFNRCIRKIQRGLVTTMAGRPTSNDGRDGVLRKATFNEPRGLALGSDGTLYVADFGVGIRAITQKRVITILRQPGAQSVSLNLRFSRYLFFSTPDDVYRIDLKTHETIVNNFRSAFQGINGFSGVVAVTPDHAFVTNIALDAIYAASFACNSAKYTCIKTFAGSDDEDNSQSGDFADGSLVDARFYNPLGMVVTSQNEIAIADSSNRRLRKMTWHTFPSFEHAK